MKYPYKKLEISVRIRSSSVRIKFYLSAFALVLILFIGCIKYQHLKNRVSDTFIHKIKKKNYFY